MQLLTTRRHRSAIIGALVTLLAVLPAAASAAKPVDHFHDRFTDSFSGELCGIAADAEVVANNNFFLLAGGGFKNTGSFRTTVTNPSNGNSIVISSAGQATGPAPIVDEQAGTITFQATFKGLPEKIQAAHGSVLLRDAGVITFVDTFDLQTGEFISSETVVQHGPHPGADSDFTRFCEVVTGALS